MVVQPRFYRVLVPGLWPRRPSARPLHDRRGASLRLAGAVLCPSWGTSRGGAGSASRPPPSPARSAAGFRRSCSGTGQPPPRPASPGPPVPDVADEPGAAAPRPPGVRPRLPLAVSQLPRFRGCRSATGELSGSSVAATGRPRGRWGALRGACSRAAREGGGGRVRSVPLQPSPAARTRLEARQRRLEEVSPERERSCYPAAFGRAWENNDHPA